MIDESKKASEQAEREKVHRRYSNRKEPDVIYPAKKQVDFYDGDVHQRVAVYVRVSTDISIIRKHRREPSFGLLFWAQDGSRRFFVFP